MGLFSKKRGETVALIDVESASVAGAYAHLPPSGEPVIYFSQRLPILAHQGEPKEEALQRTLSLLGEGLVKEGAPVLRQELGSGHVDSVLAVIGTPWNTTSVRVATVEKPQEFTFTKAVLAEALSSQRPAAVEAVRREELVIATVLNGYDVANPFGKRAHRADLIVLSTETAGPVATLVEESLRRFFHASEVRLASFAPVAYAVLRDLYPHEKDYLVLHVSGESTELAFVKRGLLVDVATIPRGTRQLSEAVGSMRIDTAGPAEQGDGVTLHKDRTGSMSGKVVEKGGEWIAALGESLKGFAARHPLPRTVFLISRAEGRGLVQLLLNTQSLHSLWLSDEPLSVIPLLPEHLTPHVKTRGTASGDPVVGLLALFAGKKTHPIET